MYHGLRRSASHVLKATVLVSGKRQNSTPSHRIDSPQPTIEKIRHAWSSLCRCPLQMCQFLCKSVHGGGLLGKWVKYDENSFTEICRRFQWTILSEAKYRGGFKEWPLVQWPTWPLPHGPRRPPMKINKKFALGLQLPKQHFYSFKLCTVDKVHAVRTLPRFLWKLEST